VTDPISSRLDSFHAIDTTWARRALGEGSLLRGLAQDERSALLARATTGAFSAWARQVTP